MTTAKPHPLKGIINTNDDPMACAVCSAPAQTYKCYTIMNCCGKDLCDACLPRSETGGICPLCKKAGVPVGTLKKHAKKGAPWAQHELGLSYRKGDSVRQSDEDANRWQEKAAKSGHPGSTYNVGLTFLFGHGRPRVDLSKATQYLRLALSRGADETKCYPALIAVAEKYISLETPETNEKARSILLPLIEKSNTCTADAHFLLGRFYHGEHDYSAAYKQYVASALVSGKEGVVAICAMLCKRTLGHHAQGRFWLGKITISKLAFETKEHRKYSITSFISYQRELRQLRDICGGCGAEFEGKERKFCRGCRAYCYCSRECQKMHWNRKKDGHREDCKAATDLKKKLKEARCHFIDAKLT